MKIFLVIFSFKGIFTFTEKYSISLVNESVELKCVKDAGIFVFLSDSIDSFGEFLVCQRAVTSALVNNIFSYSLGSIYPFISLPVVC